MNIEISKDDIQALLEGLDTNYPSPLEGKQSEFLHDVKIQAEGFIHSNWMDESCSIRRIIVCCYENVADARLSDIRLGASAPEEGEVEGLRLISSWAGKTLYAI